MSRSFRVIKHIALFLILAAGSCASTTPDPYRETASGLQEAASAEGPSPAYPVTAPQPGTKLAFLGDQNANKNSRAVLDLVRAEGTHALVILGDFDYRWNPEEWDKMLVDHLGQGFPVFVVAGNHDVQRHIRSPYISIKWPEYKKKIERRLHATPDVHCRGEFGEQYTCDFRGVRLILVSPGLLGYDEHEPGKYIEEELKSNHLFSICGWHYNQSKLQTGDKRDQAGWDVYEECRKGGGIVATAHEHSYARTHLLSAFEPGIKVAATGDPLVLRPGETFVFHSGLGGHSVRHQRRHDPWWAAVWNKDVPQVSVSDNPNRRYGALFCTFNVDGQENRAECYFKDIQEQVPDRFTIISMVENGYLQPN